MSANLAENKLPRFGQNTDGSLDVVVLDGPIAVPLTQIVPVSIAGQNITGPAKAVSQVIDMQSLGAMVGTDMRRIRFRATTFHTGSTLTLSIGYYETEAAADTDRSNSVITNAIQTDVTQTLGAAGISWRSLAVSEQFYPYAVILVACNENELFSVDVSLAYLTYTKGA